MNQLIINAALTGMIPTKADNPSLPITPDEIADDCSRCQGAGASIFHLHARDENGKPSYRRSIFKEIISRVRACCPEAILCVSTSGRVFKTIEERSEVLDLDGDLRPDMASLTLGSMNFRQQASMNDPEMIKALADIMRERGILPELEVFDFGMIDYAKYLIDKKILFEPFYFNLILGSLGTSSASALNLAMMVKALPREAVWAGAGIGRFQFFVNSMAITMGGHVRVGMEDNLYLDIEKTKPASNLGLVSRLAYLANAIDRQVATPNEARKMIGLPLR
jgi:uncharacterized protein (DUF849 family)